MLPVAAFLIIFPPPGTCPDVPAEVHGGDQTLENGPTYDKTERKNKMKDSCFF